MYKQENDIKKIKVAIIHDYLVEYGGAEKVLEALIEIWPNADLYTSDFWPEKFPEKYSYYNIRTGFISKLPLRRIFFNLYKLFHSYYFENIDLGSYDLVISDSAAFSKGVITHPRIPHIAYIQTPPRFLWGMETTRHDDLCPLYRLILAPIELYWRMWDFNAAQRPKRLVANSSTIQKRIKKIYRRDSEVIFPPVDIKKIRGNIENISVIPETKAKIIEKQPFFLVVGRLTKYKRTDLAIEAFKKLPSYNLFICGTGKEEKALKKRARGYQNINFLGRASDQIRDIYLQNAEALIFSGTEDFGIVMVEALTAGIPVIAYNKDGARDIIEDKKHGVLFDKQTPGAIIKAIRKLNRTKIDKSNLTKRAYKFSKKVFKQKILKLSEQTLEEASKYSAKNLSQN